MTWRRHLRTVRATLALRVLAIVALAADLRTWVQHHLRAGPRIPPGVHMLVALAPDDVDADDVTIDLTEHDHVVAG